MKKAIITIHILLALLSTGILFKTSYQALNIKLKNRIAEIEKAKEEQKKPIVTDPIKETLNKMSLDEKIGQMLYISYRYPDFNNELKDLLTSIKPGGFIFFKENFNNTKQAKELIASIKKTAKIPLFLGIDEEGGRVSRLSAINDANINIIPPMLEVGNTNSITYAYNTGLNIASDLKQFNLNMDFAPVLDIFSNPNNTVIGNRSFGNNASIVSTMGLSLSRGLKNSNIIPVYKHFPGHGDTSSDSHYELPVIYKTKEELYKSELIPFKEAIKNNAEVIMIGHLALPNITKNNIPASLSKEIITNLLKKEMGYKGLVVTDALNMKAITDHYTNKEIYNMAINAGVDILLMPNNPKTAITEIKALIKENKITEKQINSSVYKILLLKSKYNIK